MSTRWRRGLSFLVSVSMVLGLVPAPSLAEALEEMQPEEVVIQDETPPEEQNTESREDALEVESTGDVDTAETTGDEEEPETDVVDEKAAVTEGQDAGKKAEPTILTTQDVDVEAGNDYDMEVNSSNPNRLDSPSWKLRIDGSGLVPCTGSPVSLDSFEHIGVYWGHEGDEDYVALTEGTDYELVFFTAKWDYDLNRTVYTEIDAPTEVGYYFVAARGKDAYSGETNTNGFFIVEGDIGSEYWNNSHLADYKHEFEYTGHAINLSPVVARFDGDLDCRIDLREGIDYQIDRIVYETTGEEVDEAIEVGSYSVTCRGIGGFYGSFTLDFDVTDDSGGKFDLSLATVELSTGDFYVDDGDMDIASHMTLTDAGDKVLVLGTDYELEYQDGNGEVFRETPTKGCYDVRAVGIGDYIGETRWSGISINELTDHQSMTLGESYDVSIDEYCGWLGTFVAPTDGWYVFASEGNGITHGELYADGDLNDLSNKIGSNNDGIVHDNCIHIGCQLNEGETYQLVVRPRIFGLQTTFTVSVQKSEHDNDLSQGSIDLSAKAFFAGDGLEDAIAGAVTVYDRTGGVVGPDDYELVYYREDEETWEYVPVDAAPTEAGTYYVAARGTGSGGEGYNGETGKLDCKVTMK